MKSLIVKLLAFVVLFIGFGEVSAQNQTFKVNTEKSKVAWEGKKVGGKHNGFIKIKSGALVFTQNALSGGTFVMDMNSITNTDLEGEMNAKLVGHLKSDDFFGVATYPTASYVIKSVKKNDDGTLTISGDMTIKNKTNPVELSAIVSVKGGSLVGKAKIVIDRSKFDVRYGSKSFFNDLGDSYIHDEFELTVDLSASK